MTEDSNAEPWPTRTAWVVDGEPFFDAAEASDYADMLVRLLVRLPEIVETQLPQ